MRGIERFQMILMNCRVEMGVSENWAPSCSTLNSRILIIRTPK